MFYDGRNGLPPLAEQRVLLGGLREGVPRPGRPGPLRLRPAGRAPPAPGPAHARCPGRRRAGAGADHHELRHAAGGCHPAGAGPVPGRAADRPGPGVIDEGRVHAGHRRTPAADEDPWRPGRGHGQEHHRGAGRAGRAAPRGCSWAARPVWAAGRRLQRPRPGGDGDAPRRARAADPLPGRPDLGPAPRGQTGPRGQRPAGRRPRRRGGTGARGRGERDDGADGRDRAGRRPAARRVPRIWPSTGRPRCATRRRRRPGRPATTPRSGSPRCRCCRSRTRPGCSRIRPGSRWAPCGRRCGPAGLAGRWPAGPAASSSRSATTPRSPRRWPGTACR